MSGPTRIPIDVLANAYGVSNSSLESLPLQKVNAPGENEWFKYVIVGGIIICAIIYAHHITKPPKPIFINKNSNNE